MWKRRRARDIADADWRAALDALPLLDALSGDELDRLRELCTGFLARKTIEPVQGQTLEPADCVRIAAQACLPVLEIGLSAYDGWRSIVIYPGGFVSRGHAVDEDGVEHHWEEARSGESWFQGPVIFSWEDVEASGLCEGYNVLIHEMAHKLDMLNGDANGFPPLHAGMDAKAWHRDLSAAFEHLQACVDAQQATPIDEYAAEEPGEFFAVASEWFFELPDELEAAYPAVYAQLRAFYRQDPLARMERQD